MSNYVFSAAGTYTIPVMYTQLASINSTIDSVKYHYLEGVKFTDADFVGLEELDFAVKELNVYPNPFSGFTELKIDIERNTLLDIAVYDVMGNKVLESSTGKLAAGTHRWTISSGGLAPGIYLLRVSSPGTEPVSLKVIKQ
jgi:hypothetical protein